MTMDIIPLPVGGGGSSPAYSITTPQRSTGMNDVVSTLDRVILCTQGAPMTLTLPTGATQDALFIIKDFNGAANSFPITILTSGGDQIELPDGSGLGTAYTLDVDFQSVTIASNGAGRYFIM